MYERFTDRARQALRYANEEATKRGHEYILPEHLLLGLIREGSGIGAAALNEVCDKADRLAEAINQTIDNTPQRDSPGTRDVIELAMSERKRLNHNYVGTEHLLLALLQSSDAMLASAFASIGVDPAAIRNRTLVLRGDGKR